MTALSTRDALAKALHETRDYRDHYPGPDVCRYCTADADRIIATGAVVDVATLADDEALVERLGREAFWSDDLGMHHAVGSRPHTWENIPEIGRENYRRLMRDILRALAAALTERAS